MTLKNARQVFCPKPTSLAMVWQILSAPCRPVGCPKRRSPPKPFWLLDSRRMASRLV
jgi:hypothetical protein